MVDTRDLKSLGHKAVWVRVPLSVHYKRAYKPMKNKNDTIAEILNIENEEIEITPYIYEDKDLNVEDNKRYIIRHTSKFKVKDLIEALNKVDPDFEICISTTEWSGETVQIEVSEKQKKVVLNPYN